MLDSKKFEKITILLTIIAFVFSFATVCFPNMFSQIVREKSSKEYPVKLFGQDVINVEITVDKDIWNEMLENKMSKPYIAVNLKIDGREFPDVGLRPKGNSSLTSIRGDRISYRLDFDHYIDNQTCYGLEQMVLNNLQADATYMKDYIAYDLMEYMGVKAPLHNYAFITINGEPFGLYLAAEVYDEDYLERTFNDTNVKLYNVKSSGLDEFESANVDSENATVIKSYGTKEASSHGGPGGPVGPPPDNGFGGPGSPPQGNMQDGANKQPHNAQQPADTGAAPDNAPPPPGGGSDGGDLVYTDDNTESYSTIFANAVSKTTDAEDYARVIRAIKYLNKENVTTEELERYWDTDAALRYLAVHTFMVNGDSYTGNMKQNYYLAEQNGRITILPWDYNLSFGAFGGGPGGSGGPSRNNEQNNDTAKKVSNDKTTETVNAAIDTPTIGVDPEARPLVSVLLSKDEYKEKYHKYLAELAEYVPDGFIDKLEILENTIYPYVEKETVRFYTPEKHKTAFDVMKQFLNLRCQSICGQLDGTIPSETDLQNNSDLITVDFSIDDMGSMGGGSGGPGSSPGENNKMQPPNMQPPNMQPPDMQPPHGGRMQQPDMPQWQDGRMQPPNMQSPQGGKMQPPDMQPPNMQPPDMQPPQQGGKMQQPDMPQWQDGKMQPPGMPQGQGGDYTATIVVLLVLCAVLVGVKLFKRNY